MEQRRPAPATGREPIGGHADHRVEVGAREIAIGPGPSSEAVELVLGNGRLAARRFRNDLLRQDVEGCILLNDGVELSLPDRSEERRTFKQVVPRHRKQPTLGGAADRVTRSPDSLKERGNPVRRSDLTHQVHVPDVDAELERGRGHERAQGSGLQPHFRVQPFFFGQTAVMCCDGVLSEPLAQMSRETLGHPSRVDEDESSPVRFDQTRQPVVIFTPHLV